MRKRRYAHSWSEVASIDVDHVARWGLFRGYRGPVAFDEGMTPRTADLEHDQASDTLRVFYTYDGERILRETIPLERSPCRYGGDRVCFLAPCCGRRARKLAFLEQGIRCSTCGSITRATRRGNKIDRAIIKAEKLARLLGCDDWRGPITKRPLYMRRARFDLLMDEHAAALALVGERIAPRLEKAAERGAAAQIRAFMRAGL